jgi:hypothetical protein
VSEALRFNEGKPEVHYILFYEKFAEALAKIQEQGALKYGYANWMAGGKPDTEYLNSGLRHLFAFFNGEMYDEDLGTLHLAQACWNFINLLELNYAEFPVLDPDFNQEEFVRRWEDRPKAGHSLNVKDRIAEQNEDGLLSNLQETIFGFNSSSSGIKG